MSGKVCITVPNGPSVQGTTVTIDGVNIKHIRRVSVDLESGKKAAVTLVLEPREIVVNGTLPVETITPCPKGREEFNMGAFVAKFAATAGAALSEHLCFVCGRNALEFTACSDAHRQWLCVCGRRWIGGPVGAPYVALGANE